MSKVLTIYLFLTATVAQSKQICVSVDDLPTVHYGENNQDEITKKLIAHFKKYAIAAIGFVNEGKLYASATLKKERVDLLQQWLNGSYGLGNHTFGHTDYLQATFNQFYTCYVRGSADNTSYE
jgi:hypothetical protein